MIVQNLPWRLLALLVSLAIHAGLIAHWSDSRLPDIAEDTPPNQLFVQLSFNQTTPKAVMPVLETPPKEERPPQPEVKPVSKPKPKSVKKPTPRHKAKPEPLPEPAEPVPEETSPEEKTEENAEPPQTEIAAQPPPPPSRHLTRLREAYLARLLAEIESNKYYPTIARRRNLEGTIRVRFMLGCDGDVRELEIEGDHSLLRKAAGRAVEASMPLPPMPEEIECPMLVNYAMAYHLDQ